MKMIDAILSITIGFCLCFTLCVLLFVWQTWNCVVAVSHTMYDPMPDLRLLYYNNQHVEEPQVTEKQERYFPRFLVNVNVPLTPELQIHAQQICDQYHVGYAFFLAMCESESSFNPEALGDSGASQGLMQINRCNWERYDLDASMVFDNVEIGIRMMAELIEKYQEFDAVVMAYKGGESFADEWIAQGKRLDCCDKLVERTMYWQTVIDEGLVIE